MRQGLSIGIPTYNRKEPLIQLLRSIEKQDFQLLDEIVIGDNNSPYDVVDLVKSSLSSKFFSKCRIIQNNVNIGGPANIKNQFLYCKSKWFWLIGDDDKVTEDSLDTILKDIATHPDCAYLKYSTKLPNGKVLEEDDVRINNLQDFISYEKKHRPGNLVFMSNNIFNMEKLSLYMPITMSYFTEVPQNIPILVGLDRREVYMRFSSRAICYYIAPEGGVTWNMLQVMLAISSIQDIPFKSLKQKDIIELLGVFKLLPFRLVCGWCVRNRNKVGNYNQLHRLYYGIYSKPFRLINYILLQLCKLEFLYGINILSFIYKKYKSN